MGVLLTATCYYLGLYSIFRPAQELKLIWFGNVLFMIYSFEQCGSCCSSRQSWPPRLVAMHNCMHLSSQQTRYLEHSHKPKTQWAEEGTRRPTFLQAQHTKYLYVHCTSAHRVLFRGKRQTRSMLGLAWAALWLGLPETSFCLDLRNTILRKIKPRGFCFLNWPLCP